MNALRRWWTAIGLMGSALIPMGAGSAPVGTLAAQGAPGWRPSIRLGPTFWPAALSCVFGTDRCAAFGAIGPDTYDTKASSAEYSTDGGRSWHVATVPSTGRSFKGWFGVAMACFKDHVKLGCIASATIWGGSSVAGQVLYYSSNGGESWHAAHAPLGSYDGNHSTFPGVGCWQVGQGQECFAFDNNDGMTLLRSVDGGVHWGSVGVRTSGPPGFALGTYVSSTPYGLVMGCGAADGQLNCTSVWGYGAQQGHHIGPVGDGPVGATFSTKNAGQWWYARTPPLTGYLTTVSCGTPLFRGVPSSPAQRMPPPTIDCAAVGTTNAYTSGTSGRLVAVYSVDGGAVWSRSELPGAIVRSNTPDLACLAHGPSVDCSLNVSTLHGGELFFSGNGGKTWSRTNDPKALGGPVECFAPSSCYTGGLGPNGGNGPYGLDYSPNSGRTWISDQSGAALGSAGAEEYALLPSCVAATSCTTFGKFSYG